MINIRFGLFETNSSSTHSIYMCSMEDYNKFTMGALVLDDGELITREEAIELVIELAKNHDGDLYDDNKGRNLTEDEFRKADYEIQDSIFREYDIKTYDTMGENLEYFSSSYTTPKGEKIVAFGEYGYDY